MMLTIVHEQTPVPPPAYHRAHVRLGPALHIDALTLVNTLHLLALCRLAVRLAHHRCPPPLPAGPGGAPRTYSEESLLLIALLRTLWQLSYQDMHDWQATGQRQRWPVACQWEKMDRSALPVNLNSGNVAMRPEHLCTSPFSCSPSYTRCVLG
jgi:hypothetical protein